MKINPLKLSGEEVVKIQGTPYRSQGLLSYMYQMPKTRKLDEALGIVHCERVQEKIRQAEIENTVPKIRDFDIEDEDDHLVALSFSYGTLNNQQDYRVVLSLENEPDENKIVFIVDKMNDYECVGSQSREIDLSQGWE